MISDPRRCKTSILNSISEVHKNVQIIELDWNKHKIETGEHIIALLDSVHWNVKGLQITGGVFRAYNRSLGISGRSHNITQLIFTNIDIAAKRVLPELSKGFSYLEY